MGAVMAVWHAAGWLANYDVVVPYLYQLGIGHSIIKKKTRIYRLGLGVTSCTKQSFRSFLDGKWLSRVTASPNNMRLT